MSFTEGAKLTKKKVTLTHILMITDMSGSMHNLAQDVRGGFNSYIAELRNKPGNYLLTATVFDTEVERLCTGVTLDDAPSLDKHNYSPRGMTALLDAVGQTVAGFDAMTKLRTTERVLVVIQTDGEENSSREWNYIRLNRLIKDREATGQWGFVYLGVGLDTWQQANWIGVDRANYINTPGTSTGTQSTFSGLIAATVAYAGGKNTRASTQVLRDAPGVLKTTDDTSKEAKEQ